MFTSRVGTSKETPDTTLKLLNRYIIENAIPGRRIAAADLRAMRLLWVPYAGLISKETFDMTSSPDVKTMFIRDKAGRCKSFVSWRTQRPTSSSGLEYACVLVLISEVRGHGAKLMTALKDRYSGMLVRSVPSTILYFENLGFRNDATSPDANGNTLLLWGQCIEDIIFKSKLVQIEEDSERPTR